MPITCMFYFADVWNFTIRFHRTNVPKKVTSYFCQAFEMPTNGTFHMIGTSPAIDNAYVMHHILAFGCSTKPSKMHNFPTLALVFSEKRRMLVFSVLYI